MIQPFQANPSDPETSGYQYVPSGLVSYITDGHGSTRALLYVTYYDWQTIGTLLQRYTYDAYGNALGFDPLFAGTTHLYSGEQYDAHIQRQFLRARWYDRVRSAADRCRIVAESPRSRYLTGGVVRSVAS